MRQYNFKIYPEDDPEVIKWLDSLTRKRRSEEIRRALRAYKRSRVNDELRKVV